MPMRESAQLRHICRDRRVTPGEVVYSELSQSECRDVAQARMRASCHTSGWRFEPRRTQKHDTLDA